MSYRLCDFRDSPSAYRGRGEAPGSAASVNHPFFPAWRALPIEVVLSGDETYGDSDAGHAQETGKVPIITKDVACFAADDIFRERLRGGGAHFCRGKGDSGSGLEDRQRRCRWGRSFQERHGPDEGQSAERTLHAVMWDAPTGTEWFEPPPIFNKERTPRGWILRTRAIRAMTKRSRTKFWTGYWRCSSGGLFVVHTTYAILGISILADPKRSRV